MTTGIRPSIHLIVFVEAGGRYMRLYLWKMGYDIQSIRMGLPMVWTWHGSHMASQDDMSASREIGIVQGYAYHNIS